MTGEDHALIGYGQGTVDFKADQVATVDHYLISGERTPGDEAHSSEPRPVRTITTPEAVHILAPVGDQDDEWLAIEAGRGGLTASVLAPLLWLRGSTINQNDHHHWAGQQSTTLDLAAYLEQLELAERAGTKETLEFGRIGLSGQQISAIVSFTAGGLIERMTTFIPPGVSTIVPVGHEAIEHHIALEWLRERPTIPTPDSHLRVSASEFVQATLVESGVAGWHEDSEEPA